MRERKWLRILLWFFVGFVSLVLVLLFATYFILRTPSVQQRILASLREPLKEQGVDLKVRSLSVDLLAGVTLDELSIGIRRPPEIEGDVRLAELRLRYKIWPLLRRELIISEARLSGIEGELRLNPTPSPEEKKEETPSDPEALTKLLDLLRRPPARVDIPAISLANVKLHVLLNQGPMAVDLWLRDLGLEAGLQLQPGEVALSLNGKVPLEVNVTSTEGLDLKTALQLSPDLAFALNLDGQRLKWQLDLKELALGVDALTFRQTSPTGTMAMDLEPLTFRTAIKLDHDGTVPEAGVKPQDLALPLGGKGNWDLLLKSLALKQKDLVSKSPETHVFVRVEGANEFSVSLPREIAKLDQMDWELENSLKIKDLKVTQGKDSLLASPTIDLQLKADGSDGQGNVDLDLDLKTLTLKGLNRPLTIAQTLEAALNFRQARTLDWNLTQSLNGRSWLRGEGKLNDDGRLLTSQMKLGIQTFSDWQALHPAFAQLNLAGWPKIDLNDELTLAHAMPLEEISGENWEQLTITNKLALGLQQQETNAKTLAKFKELALSLEAGLQGKVANAKLDLKVEDLQHKLLKKTADLVQTLRLDGDFTDYLKAKVDAKTELGGQELMRLAIKADERPKNLSVQSQIDVTARPNLKNYMDGLEILDDVGVLHLTSKDKVNLSYPQQRLAEVASWAPEKINLHWDSAQSLDQDDGKALKYRLPSGLGIASDLKLRAAKLDLETRVKVPAASVKDLADVRSANVLVKAQVVDVRNQNAMAVIVNGGADRVALAGDDKKALSDLLQKASFQLRAQLSAKDRLTIPLVEARLQDTLLHFRGSGNATLSTGRGGFQGMVSSTLPEGRNLAGLQGKGSFQFPFTVTLYDKKVLALRADPKFEALSFRYGDISASNLNGSLAVHEELRIDEQGRIGFLYLDTQNPFARVDFENVDPYLGQKSQLSIDQIRFKHIELGPLVQNFEIRQNLVLLNDLKINLLEGSALGRLFVDLHPARLQLGFLGRFSGLQPELLKDPARRRRRQTAEFDGRAALNFDIRKRLATGRIDITSIGRDQLLSLLDLLDPNYEDPQMMMARRALQVAYPNLVSIGMEQGLMDIMIGLGGVISQDIHVRSIPLTAFINANAGEALGQIEKFLEETGGH